MAEDRSVGGLFLGVGLNLSELETGFVTASQTISQNISRLNRESNLVRIRSEVEIAGLDETADAERILQIRQEALNRQMAIQRDRVRILDAELQNLVRTQGENSVAAQRATTTLERARLALANMEREARNLSETHEETNSGFSGLSGILAVLPPQLRAVAAGMTAVGTGAGMAGKSAEALLENFRELQTQAYELNMSVGKTRDFLMKLRLGGGDIGDLEGFIRGITDALVKGEVDDPEFVALSKYGAKITDATGRLKDFKDITEEVYQAWKKADEAGEGIEFLQLTGGESGIRDAIQFFKRYEEAVADAQKVMKSGIDDTQLHDLDRAMKLVEEQAGELKNALGDIFVPAAQSAAESFFETLHKGTEFLVENKDEIQRWGFIAKEAFSTAGDKISNAFEAAGKKISEVNEMLKGKTGNSRVDKILGDMSWRYGGTQPAFGIDQMISGQVDDAKKSFGVLDDFVKKAEQAQAEYNAELKKTADQLAETDKQLDRNPLSQYAAQRVQQFKDELADLRIDLDFDDEIEKAKAKLGLWFDREYNRKLFLSDEEKNILEELYDAKLEQIDKELEAAMDAVNERIQEHWKNAADIEYELTHTAFEKQIRDIEQWEEAETKRAKTKEEIAGIVAEATAREAQAFEREMDRIKNATQSLEDEIFDMEHSKYESDIRRAMQKYQKALEEGVDFSVAQRWLNDKLKGFNTRAKESRNESGDYTKRPEGAMRRGGNGISVIEGDQIVDDGLKSRQYEVGLIANENQIRQQLLPNLSREAQEKLAAIQATKTLTDAQRELAQTTTQSGYQVIEGDEVVSNPQPSIDSEQTISGLKEFDSAVQGAATTLEQFNQPVADFQNLSAAMAQSESDFQASLKRMAENLPADYFKTLADNSKAVSEMQLALTKSTMELIDAQSELKAALKDFPKTIPTNNQQSAKELMNLSTQGQLNPQVSDIPRQQSNGMKFDFDWDVFGGLAGLAALIPHPAAKALAIGGAIGAGAGVGTFNQSETQSLQPSMPNIDLTGITTALSGIDAKTQSILQQLETPKETTTFETIVTPLNNIATITGNILSALGNRQPPQVTVSPTNQINLGGAYVFDNAMKKSLVDDITSNVVDEITRAVEQATSRSNYSFGA